MQDLINDLTGFQAARSLVHGVRGLSARRESRAFPQLFTVDCWDFGAGELMEGSGSAM